MPFYIKKNLVLTCEDCGHTETLKNVARTTDARKHGWSISKDYKKCYCPSCGWKHQSVGCRGYEHKKLYG